MTMNLRDRRELLPLDFHGAGIPIVGADPPFAKVRMRRRKRKI